MECSACDGNGKLEFTEAVECRPCRGVGRRKKSQSGFWGCSTVVSFISMIVGLLLAVWVFVLVIADSPRSRRSNDLFDFVFESGGGTAALIIALILVAAIVPPFFAMRFAAMKSVETVTCPLCGGTGTKETTHTMACKRCRGSGKID